jgi:aspartate aminotransferase-like enzyme
MLETVFMLPGPTEVPQAVAQAMSRPMINHRGEGFKRLFSEVQAALEPLLNTDGGILILPGSGTGAMECAAVNLLEPGESALVVAMGAFGHRFADICRGAGISVINLNVPWGEVPDPQAIRAHIETAGPKAVFVTHNETSTGTCLDLEGVGRALASTGVFLVVDAVSSLGGIPVNMREWGIDVLVSASQKALMTPPGLALVAFSPRAQEAAARNPRPRYYWDWNLYLRDALKSQTPYTPALPQWFGLLEALRLIEAEGLESVFARHRAMSRMTRAGLEIMGAPPLGMASYASPTVTAFRMPGGINADQVRQALNERYGMVAAGGQGHLKGEIIRFGHMGAATTGHVLAALERLGLALRDVGATVDVPAALEAARQAGGEGT